MTSSRLPDWEVRFGGFVTGRQSMPFVWGRNDCVLFGADCVEAITGRDLAVEFRGTYHCAAGAMRVLRHHGGLVSAVSEQLGEAFPGALARIGDVCLVRMDGRHALGVCNGAIVLGPGLHGVQQVSLTEAVLCWRV